MPSESSVGVVLATKTRPYKYLILRYGAGHWEFPRGNKEKGESEEETARRECEEETGISEIDFIEGFREQSEWFFKRDKETVHKTAVYLLATTDEKKVTLSHEHTSFAWLAYGDALEKVTFENAKDILKKAHRRLGSS